jgi:hypothetical protein
VDEDVHATADREVGATKWLIVIFELRMAD